MISCVAAQEKTIDLISAINGSHQQFIDINIYSIFSRVPIMGSELIHFIVSPKEFTQNFTGSSIYRINSKEVIAWSIGVVFILFGIYRIIFGDDPYSRHSLSALSNELDVRDTPARPKSNPKIIRFGLGLRTEERGLLRSLDGKTTSEYQSTGIQFPVLIPSFIFPEINLKGFNVPQTIVIQSGFLSFIVDDIIPADLSSKKVGAIGILVCSIIIALSMYPFALFLGSNVELFEDIEFTIIIFSFSIVFLFISQLIIFLLLDFKNIKFSQLAGRNSRLFLLGYIYIFITFGLAIRANVASFITFYSVGYLQFIALFLGAFFLSLILSPLIFIPLFFIFIRFKNIIDIII
jgi:hypothetical protein